jgi:hypothetical protein
MGHGVAGGDDRSGCTSRLRDKPSQSFERVPALPQRFGPGLWVQMTYPSHQSIPMIGCTRPVTLLTRAAKQLFSLLVLHTHCKPLTKS